MTVAQLRELGKHRLQIEQHIPETRVRGRAWRFTRRERLDALCHRLRRKLSRLYLERWWIKTSQESAFLEQRIFDTEQRSERLIEALHAERRKGRRQR